MSTCKRWREEKNTEVIYVLYFVFFIPSSSGFIVPYFPPQFRTGTGIFLFKQTQTAAEAYPVSYLMATVGSFFESKVAIARSCTSTPIEFDPLKPT
jgi:hypothetical protein